MGPLGMRSAVLGDSNVSGQAHHIDLCEPMC
jgi:hypothetical protein